MWKQSAHFGREPIDSAKIGKSSLVPAIETEKIDIVVTDKDAPEDVIKGLMDKAVEHCKIAIQIDPEYGNAYNDIGAYLLSQKRLDEAIPWFEKAFQATNYANYCYPYLNLGRIYEFKGRWNLALDYYANAIQENPEYEPAQTAYDQLAGKYN